MASLRAATPLLSASRPSVSSRGLVSRPAVRPALPVRRVAPAAQRAVATKAAVEIAQVAGEIEFIAGTAFTMMGITLVGLALGFVLLRVETLVQEGKL